jgi:FAD/FMN-containing dehydrogenase
MADLTFSDEVAELVAARPTSHVLAVGLGRSYGNSNTLAGGSLIDVTQLDRILMFDAEAGILRAKAGLSLSQALGVIVPQGWFLPATPGTRFVTLGGAVANDVHGKNHHLAGSFGCAVRAIGLQRSDGRTLALAPGDPLFAATIGGLGLTGLITWVEIALSRIPGTRLLGERTAFGSLKEFASLITDAERRFEHTVAWIDCANGGSAFGRGILEAANWTHGDLKDVHRDQPRLTVPVDAPSFTISGPTVRGFNAFYFNAKRWKAGPFTQHYADFFYPLDALGRWNRLYGRRGFHQYQCVIPAEAGIEPLEEMLQLITRSANASFLAVLKRFGSKVSPGILSFPREGLTLALDFPNRGVPTLDLLARLDAIVREAGGRLYPAKDARMSRAMFELGYPRLDHFRAHVDPAFSSDFWKAVNA